MKKLFTLLLVCSLTITYAQEVPEVQKSLLSKISADWCSNCGSWGWNLWKDLIDDNSDNAVFMAVHHSGGLETPTSNALSNNFQIIGQPRFYINNNDQGVGSSSASAKRIEIQNTVNANNLNAPIANAGMIATLDGNALTVNTKTRFFQDASGEYYVGVYIIEDNFVAPQSQQGQNAEHRFLLHDGMSGGDYFGVAIASGDITSGQEFLEEFTMDLNTNWNVENMSVAAIVWKKEGNIYNLVNINEVSTFGIANSVSDVLAKEISISTLPTISNQSINLSLDLEKSQSDLQINLMDQSGRIIQDIFRGTLANGKHNFTINKASATGMYFVVVQTNEGVLTKKVIFK